MSTYIIIALGLTWICWIPALKWTEQGGYTLPTVTSLATDTPFSFVSQQHLWISVLFSFAVYGPLLGGLVATYLAQGMPGLRALVRGMVRWRVGWKWYGITVLLVLIIALLPLALGLLAGVVVFKASGVSSGGSFAPTTLLFLLVFSVLTSGLGEEPGWRGDLLPALQASYPQGKAIWIMGLVWAIWHFPFTIYATMASLDPSLGASAAVVIVPALLGQTMSIIGIAYLYTWLFNHTGSLFLLMFFHALSNVVPEMVSRSIVPNPLLPLITAVMPWLIVFTLEKLLGKERFPGQMNTGSR